MGVSPMADTGTTVTRVKAPKCGLSVKPNDVPKLRHPGDRLGSSHSLRSASQLTG